MLFAICFIIIHWYLSLFCQSFYLHRYCSHNSFSMGWGWRLFFHILTIITQGPSFLNPNAYAQLHRRHHSHSDEVEDPHSPHHSRNIIKMMFYTYSEYQALLNKELDKRSQGPRTILNDLSSLADKWPTRLAFVLIYISAYLLFTDSLLYLMLVPIHSLLGPIHGAIVNWCGHKYGQQRYNNQDYSKNTLVIDFLMMGELYQNNHHASPKAMNFAHGSKEIDFTFIFAIILKRLNVIQFRDIP